MRREQKYLLLVSMLAVVCLCKTLDGITTTIPGMDKVEGWEGPFAEMQEINPTEDISEMVNDSIYAVDENTTYPYLNDTYYYSEPLIYAITFYGTLSMWILGIILNLVTIFAIGLGRNIVAVFWPGLSSPAYGSLVLMMFAIICITVATCYTLVVIKLCLRKRRSLNSHTSRQQHDSITKLQVMVMVDAILTAVTWMPYMTYIFTVNITHLVYTDSLSYPLATLTYINTFSTPVVYLVFNRYFREDVKLLFIRIFCRRNSSPQNNNEQIIQQQIQLQPMTPSREV